MNTFASFNNRSGYDIPRTVNREVNISYKDQFNTAAIFGLLKQSHFKYVLEDLSVDNNRYIPVKRDIWHCSINNSDFNDQGRNPTVNLNISKGFKLNMAYVTFTLPAQYAKTPSDMMCYDSLPGIQCIQQLEINISNNIQIETVTPQIMIQRYIDFFGYDLFMELASKWFGGVKTDTKCDPNQVLHGVVGDRFDTKDQSKNVILPPTQIILPLPISLLYNDEKYCFVRLDDCSVEVKFLFKNIVNIITRTTGTYPTPLSGTLDLYIENLVPNEFSESFNNLEYSKSKMQAREDYYVMDRYIELQNTCNPIGQQLKVQIKPGVVNKLSTYICDKQWVSSYSFFGDTCAKATENFIASMIFTDSGNRTPNISVNLSTGVILGATGTNNKSSGQLSIVETGSNYTVIQWQKTQTTALRLKITCTTAWAQMSDIFIDFGVMPGILPSNSVCPQIFFLSSFNLDIVPFVQDGTVFSLEDTQLTYMHQKKLARGFFTFNPSTDGVNQHAFYGVSKVVLSNEVSAQDWNFIISQPVPSNQTGSVFSTKNQVIIQRNNYPFWDLDGKQRIVVDSLIWEKGGSNNETFTSFELELLRDRFKLDYYHKPQIELLYEFIEHVTKKKSGGFMDFRKYDYLYYTIKIQTRPIVISGTQVSDIFKEKNAAGCEVEILSLQSSSRIIKYTVEGTIEFLTRDARSELNRQIRDTVLIPEGLYLDESKIRPPPPNAASDPPTSARYMVSKRARVDGYDANKYDGSYGVSHSSRRV